MLIPITGCQTPKIRLFPSQADPLQEYTLEGKGDGKILANFREIPALCRPVAETVTTKLQEAGLRGLIVMGNTSEPVCEIPVELNKIGVILLGGLNPVAAAEEAGIEVENHAMSTILEYQDLIKLKEL